MISHRIALRLCLVAAVVASGGLPGRAQEKKPGAGDLVARVPGESFQRLSLVITAADPAGPVRFELDPTSPLRQYGLSDFIVPGDGHALMAVRPAAAPEGLRLYRVEIREITAVDLPAWGFTADLTPAVAAQLRAGDLAGLVRPPWTTEQLRALPDSIPIPAAAKPSPDEAREAAARARSSNNLKQIGIGLHNFHAAFGQFPPAVIHGPDGKPWHSWRVLVLPYVEQADLFNQYQFDEPWDGPNNIKLLDRMPDVFRDPIHGADRGHFTHYAALVGQATAFPPTGAALRDAKRPVQLPIGQGTGGATRIRDFTDGTSNTLLIAPVAPDRKIPWTKPEDITVGPEFPGLGRPGGIAAPYRSLLWPATHHAAPVLFADGSVRVLIDTIEPRVLAVLLTRAGGEVVSSDAIVSDPASSPTPPLVAVRIHREGGRVQATIEPAELAPPAGTPRP